MHYYQHHIGDFIRDTSRLNNDQSMAYLRLLWIYYDTEKPLVDDPESLAFQIGADEKDVRLILSHFFRITDGMRTHKRCDEEIAMFHSKSEKARGSANARWRNANAMRTHNERNANESKSDANQEPRTKNQEPEESKPKAAKAARFDPLSLYLGGVPDDKWGEWVAYRKSRKLSNAEATMRSQVDSLNNWREKGHDPAHVIAESIRNGWQGLFEPKSTSPPRQQFISHADQSKLAAARAIFGTEIEGSHGTQNGRTIDITPPARQVGRENLSGTTGQLRLQVSEPVEDGTIVT